MKNKQSGFTLIEIAVVLVIVSFLVGSFINTFSNRIETSRISDTEKELNDIKQAVMAFAYGRPIPLAFLPCPDSDVPPDGLENRDGAGDCSVDLGTLPWQDLGFARQDAWGTQYRYWVNTNYANSAAGFDLNTAGAGSATIRTRVNDALTDIGNNAVAVIFSHGKNSLGGISAENINQQPIPAVGNGFDDENENMDNDTTFIARYRTDEGVATAGGVYDDIVVWINMYELKAKMVEAGKLP